MSGSLYFRGTRERIKGRVMNDTGVAIMQYIKNASRRESEADHAIAKILKLCEEAPEVTGNISFCEVMERCVKIEEVFFEIDKVCREVLDG